LPHGINAACNSSAEHQNAQQRNAHDNALDQISSACGKKSANRRIGNDNNRTDEHGRCVIKTEHTIEKLSAGGKTGSGIRNKENQDDNAGDPCENFFGIAITVGEKFRQGDGVLRQLRIAAQTTGYRKPVDISADRQTDCRPTRIRNTGQICNAGKSHEKPAAHI